MQVNRCLLKTFFSDKGPYLAFVTCLCKMSFNLTLSSFVSILLLSHALFTVYFLNRPPEAPVPTAQPLTRLLPPPTGLGAFSLCSSVYLLLLFSSLYPSLFLRGPELLFQSNSVKGCPWRRPVVTSCPFSRRSLKHSSRRTGSRVQGSKHTEVAFLF